VLSPFTLVDGIVGWAFGSETSMELPPDGAGVGLGQVLVFVVLAAGAAGLLLLRYRRVAVA
jgi:K+-transporting ATPase A subunit